MDSSVRMPPVSIASRKGISALASEAASHRVILTSLGRPVAVIDAAERIDEDLRRVREAARVVVEAFADRVAERTGFNDLESVCERLGVDPAQVRARSQQLQNA